MRFQFHHIIPFVLLWLGCGTEPTAFEAPPPGVGELAQEESTLQDPGCPGCGEGARFVSGFERRRVVDDIYHYSARIQGNSGAAHDIITLHRVVREREPGLPARTREAVFMVHGDAWGFQGAFMASTLTGAVPVDHSIAIYLAKRGVDVWGIDLRWTHVPLETENFDFMKEWNVGTHVQDVGKGLAVARRVRLETGSDGGKMNLLAWSRGAVVGYAYLNEEMRRSPEQRHVSGFIPVDMVLKFGPEAEEQRQWACKRASLAKNAREEENRYEGGLLGPGAGVGVMQVGQAAIAQPDVVAWPPLTYYRLGLSMGAMTYLFTSGPQSDIPPMVPFYHFTAGQFGDDGFAVGLRYVKPRQLFDLFSAARPYQSFNEIVESEQLMCGEDDLPYDDHLSEVDVPVLYVGAAGGFGDYGVHSTTLLGSKDVSVLMVRRESAEARRLDYGHADLFLAEDAEKAVWAPILKWMKRH